MVRFRWFAVRFRWFAVLAAAGSGLLGSRPLMAQSQTAPQAELQNEIDQLKRKVEALEAVNAQLQHLDQQVKIVDRKLDQQQSATREEALTRPVVDAGPAGFFIHSPDSSYNLHIGGYPAGRWAFLSFGTEANRQRISNAPCAPVLRRHRRQVLRLPFHDGFRSRHHHPGGRLRRHSLLAELGSRRVNSGNPWASNDWKRTARSSSSSAHCRPPSCPTATWALTFTAVCLPSGSIMRLGSSTGTPGQYRHCRQRQQRRQGLCRPNLLPSLRRHLAGLPPAARLRHRRHLW